MCLNNLKRKLMKTFKNINRLFNFCVLIILLTPLFQSCDLPTKSCSNEEYLDLEKISEGDFETYKAFIEKHGPNFSCWFGLTPEHLKYSVSASQSLKMYIDYFSYDIDQNTKNLFLNWDWKGKSDSLVWFLIRSGAELDRIHPSCDSSTLYNLKRLHYMGYKLKDVVIDNSISKVYPENLFFAYATYSFVPEVCDCYLDVLKFLKSIGVDTNYKDKQGKSAIDVAANPCIKEYLKKL